MSKREKYTNKMQIEAIVDLMKKNQDFACGFSQRVLGDIKKFWEDLTLTLNGCGPPLKDSSGWKKVWTDYKSGVKKKLAKNEQILTGTGEGPYKEIPLTDIEEEVSVLLNLNTAGNGMANVKNFGVSKRHDTSSVAEISLPLEPNICLQDTDLPLEENAVTLDSENNETSTQRTSVNVTPRPLKRARKETKPELLKEQINVQKKLASDVASALEVIKEQNKESHKALRDIKRAIYTLGDEEKKQTKILEQQLAEEKKHNEEMKRLLMKKIALKERILQLEIEKLDKELQ